jgi:hypothetical protein
MKSLIASAVMLRFPRWGTASAQDQPAAAVPTAASLSDVLAAWGIMENGYIAASYYHSNGYDTFHQFYVGHDSFQLDQAALTLAYEPKSGLGALVTVAAQALKEGTLTVGYDPVKSFELRIEVRYDESDRATFVRAIKEDGDVSAFADSQNEFALQGVYKF